METVTDVVEDVGNVVDNVVGPITEKFGLVDAVDELLSYPRVTPDCRYDNSALPGLACALRLEFSAISFIEVALNAEFGLQGGSIPMTKISTGVRSSAIPETCGVYGLNFIMKGLCKAAELAAGLFEKLFDLGSIVRRCTSH